MNDTKTELGGPDLAEGVSLSQIADGAMLLGQADGEAVLVARRGDELFAIGASSGRMSAISFASSTSSTA